MLNKKITQLTEITEPSADDLLVGVNDPSGTPETVKITRANLGKGLINETPETGNYSLTADDEVKLFDTTSGDLSAFLPTANGARGKKYTIIKVAGSNNVIIDPDGSETINSDSTYAVVNMNEAVTIISDDSNWKILNTYTA